MHRPASTITLLTLLAACAAPSTPMAPTSEAPTPSSTPASAPEQASSGGVLEPDDSAPTDAQPSAAPTSGLPTREQLDAKRSLDRAETPFPEIAEVTKELGAPAVQGTVRRVEFRYDAKPFDKTFSCQTLDVLRLPSGAAVIDASVLTSPECKTVNGTEKQLRGAVVALGVEDDDRQGGLSAMLEKVSGKPFEEVVKQLEKALGKPAEQAEVPVAAWRYVDWDERCKLVVVTKALGSGAGQAIWGTPCE